MGRKTAAFLALPLAALCLLSSPAVAQVVQVTNSYISGNVTWGPTGTVVGTTFWVRTNVYVYGGNSLTIQPGVVVKFDYNCRLNVYGKLRALGTAADTVVFTAITDDQNRAGDTNGDGVASSPYAGGWSGVTFGSAGSDSSRLEFADLRYAGTGLSFEASRDTVSNCLLRYCQIGASCSGDARPVLRNSRIEKSSSVPLLVDALARPITANLVFSKGNNSYDAIGLQVTSFSGNATIPIRSAIFGPDSFPNVTYVLTSHVSVLAGGTLTFAPGVVIKSSGWSISSAGTLNMVGTATDSITVTSIHDDSVGYPRDTNNNLGTSSPQPNNWGNIQLYGNAVGDLRYCRIRYGTTSNSLGMVQLESGTLSLSHSLLSHASHALGLQGATAPLLDNLVLDHCSSTPIIMSTSTNPSFGTLQFANCPVVAIGLGYESITGDTRISRRDIAGYINIAYLVLDNITVSTGGRLTIDPGVVLKFVVPVWMNPGYSSSGALWVYGTLIAEGRPDSLIVMTSGRDDSFGTPGDTNGDGPATSPNSGDWGPLYLTGATSNSRMNWCYVAYGGRNNNSAAVGGVWLVNTSPTIRNCVVTRSYYGFQVEGACAPTIDSCAVASCNSAPILMSVLANPSFNDMSFAANGINGIGLIGETITQNAVLRHRPLLGSPPYAYVTMGTIGVGSSATLEIEPRVVIKPNGGSYVFDVAGTLRAIGGPGQGRIVITSLYDDTYGGDTYGSGSPATGHASAIRFGDTSVDAACVLRNILYQFGGAAITTNNASPSLSRLEFFRCTSPLYFSGTSAPVADSITILSSTSVPVVISLMADPAITNLTLGNNAWTGIGIPGETVPYDVRTRVRGLGAMSNAPYLLMGSISIPFGARWTIDPGVVLKLDSQFGSSSINVEGALVADGKPDSLIVFTSVADDAFGGDSKGDGAATQPAPGQWRAIQFGDNSNDAQTLLRHCRVRYGGYYYSYNSGGYYGVSGIGAVDCYNSSPRVEDCVFTSNIYAVSMDGSAAPQLTNSDFDSSSVAPFYMSLRSQPQFTGGHLRVNANDAIATRAETITQDMIWPIRAIGGKANVPYLLDGTLTLGLGATVRLQPGLVVKFANYYSGIHVERALQAEGGSQPESLIVFTDARDDFYGGDTNNNGGATAPSAGSTGYVRVKDSAIDSEVRFRNCAFRYGGYNGALALESASPAVDSCLFAYCYYGIYATGSSNPVVRNSSFIGSAYRSIQNSGTSFCIDARQNWWGDPTGPKDNSGATDLCGSTINAGLGDEVSTNVDYANWRTSGGTLPLLGDVSLNGALFAYDASLVLQHTSALISLNGLQRRVADVSGAGGISAFDATLILQVLSNVIRAFPILSNAAGPVPPDVAAARRWVERATGSFEVGLGESHAEGDEWVLPIEVQGTAPAYSLEVLVAGLAPSASARVTTTASTGALSELGSGPNGVRLSLAAPLELGHGEVVQLRVPRSAWTPSQPLALLEARVNESETRILDPVLPLPLVTSLGPATPNPSRDAVTFALAVASRESGREVRARVVDVSGRVVRTLAARPVSAGSTSLMWDLHDDEGRAVRPGLYWLQARLGGIEARRRVVVVP